MEPALLELLAEGDPDDEVAVILRLSDPTAIPDGVRIIARFGLIATCRLRRAEIPRVRVSAHVRSMKAARFYEPTLPPGDPAGVDDNGQLVLHIDATDVRRPSDGLPTGGAVIVAHIDWGVDFAHPDFRNPDGSTRLVALWNQDIEYDPLHSNRYGYGRIYEPADIDRALAAPDPYKALEYHPAASDPTGLGSHGTHTLSISAGNGRGGGPFGLAPAADLVFVHFSTSTAEGQTLLGDSVAFLEALDFISDVAGTRPMVINASLGRQCGEHDGKTLTEQGMDAFLRTADGRAICMSTGNYFDRKMHAHDRLRPGGSQTLRLVIEDADPGPNELDLWYPGTDRFALTLQGPGGLPMLSAPPGAHTPIIVEGMKVGRLYHRLGDPNNGDNEVTIFLDPIAPRGTWELTLVGLDVVDGRYHAWIERSARGGRNHAHFIAADSDPTCTTGTICNGFWTIAVGAYDGHEPDRRLTHFTSSGPTRYGRQKPDLVAPGMRVLAARSRPLRGEPDQPGLTRMSGTSMAAPHVTGTIALMFDAAARPLSIAETRRHLLSSIDLPPLDIDPADRLRLGNGYLNTPAAVAAVSNAAPQGPVAGAPVEEARPPTTDDAERRSDETEHNLERDEMSESNDEADADMAERLDEPENTDHNDSLAERTDRSPAATRLASGPHYRGLIGAAPLPFMFEIPIGGGAPGLAVPIGGAGSPFAFSLPLGGTPTPSSSAGPQTLPQPVASSAAPPDAPVTVAATDAPLYVPPGSTEGESEEDPGEDEQIGELLMAAADALSRPGAPRPRSTAAFLQSLITRCLPAGRSFTLSPLGPNGPAPSATALFNAIVCRRDARLQRDALHRHYTGHFEVVGHPGEPIADVVPRSGDLLLRVAHGEGWASIAVVASSGLHAHHRLSELNLRGEGYPRLAPGAYVHVIEPGQLPRISQSRFARRVCDRDNIVLRDTLLLRLRPATLCDGGTELEDCLPSPSGVPGHDVPLRLGASGTAVRQAQSQLNRVHADLVALGHPGLPGCPLNVDGRFTSRMELAVRAFQQQVFSDPFLWDGSIGAKTQSQLDLLAAAVAPQATAVQRGPDGVASAVDNQQGEFTSLAEIAPDCVNSKHIISGFPEYAVTPDKLAEEQQAILQSIVSEIVSSFSTDKPIVAILVVGHADVALRKPVAERDAFELTISQQRAKNALDMIMAEVRRLGRGRAEFVKTQATGVGATQRLVTDPKTESDMKLNRRVEVLLAQCALPPVPPPDTFELRIARFLELLKTRQVDPDPTGNRTNRARCIVGKLLRPGVLDVFVDGTASNQQVGNHFVGENLCSWQGKYDPPLLSDADLLKFLGTVSAILKGSGFAPTVSDDKILIGLSQVIFMINEGVVRVERYITLNSSDFGYVGDKTRGTRLSSIFADHLNDDNSIYSCYKDFHGGE